MTPTRWSEFKAQARKDGQLIENAIKHLYSAMLPADAVAIDGGAHVGFHTLPLAKVLTRGRLIAVEANRSTFGRLKTNAQGIVNISFVNAALQDDERLATVSFHCSTSHPGRSGVGRLWDLIAPGQVTYRDPDTVAATTIDKLVRDHALKRLDFIKLDLEGGEFRALKGAQQTLQSFRPLIVTEHSSQAAELNGYAMSDYFALLSASAYTPLAPNGEVVTADNPVPFWYVFLVPDERVADMRARVIASVEHTLREAETPRP